jgi:glycosyltransferase involved in cell wall biosynthesis
MITNNKVQLLLKQKKRSFQKGQKRGRVDGFQRGHIDGFQRGIDERATQSLEQQGTYAEIEPVAFLGEALIITPSMELPSLEIILSQPFRELQRRGLYNFNIKIESEVSLDDLIPVNIVIFLRCVEQESLRYMELAHELGKRTIYVIDDNFLEISQASDVSTYYGNIKRREVFVNFLINAKLVKVCSAYFADYIRLNFNSKVVYFPASVDFSLFDNMDRPVRDDGIIVIGYEGTNKEEDFSVVVPALKKIMSEYGHKVRFEFEGFIPGELSYDPHCSFTPISLDYRSYMPHLYQSNWDIGLAPLRDSIFNYCKTNNKYRGYASCFIPGIYSESPAYKDWVIQGETGIMVPHTSEGWYLGLKQLIDDKELRIKIKNQAEVLARQQFSMESCVGNWLGHIIHT